MITLGDHLLTYDKHWLGDQWLIDDQTNDINDHWWF